MPRHPADGHLVAALRPMPLPQQQVQEADKTYVGGVPEDQLPY